MGNLSPPFHAATQTASPLDHQGGLSLWLRAGIFALALLTAARPDRWGWSLPSLHAVFFSLFAYSILGDFVISVLAIPAMIALFVAVVALIYFDRIVYVPTYRLARSRFRLSALAAFGLAVAIEGAVASGLIFTVRNRARFPKNDAPASLVAVRHPQKGKRSCRFSKISKNRPSGGVP